MKLQSIVLAALLSTAFGGAMAENYTVPAVTLNGEAPHWTGAFGVSHTAGLFTDTYTFNYTGVPAAAEGFFANFSNSSSDINFTGAWLNGTALQTTDFLTMSGSVFKDVAVAGKLTLVISGKAIGNAASYAGTIDVTSAVPEPTTYGMLLGGLGVMGFLARRRKA